MIRVKVIRTRKGCEHPGCTYPHWAKGYCKMHQQQRPDVGFTTICPVNEDRKELDEEYFVLRDWFLSLPKNELCKIGAPGCTYLATVIHHVCGRILFYLAWWTWKPSCRSCNQFVEDNHEWAEKNGHKGSKFSTSFTPENPCCDCVSGEN